MSDEIEISGKRIDFWAHPEDVEVIEGIKRRYGNCTTSAAIRACIRIAKDVKLLLDRPAPIKDE